jgi:putative transposase
MVHLLILAVHVLATIAKLVRPGGVRAVVAESALPKHQLVISSRARRRAPNLNSVDRFVFGLGPLFVPASRLPKLAVILKLRILLRFHEALKRRKYRWLFSSASSAPRPKRAIAGTHRRDRRVQAPQSPGWLPSHRPGDCPYLWHRYRQDIVRRVLAKHYRPRAGTDGPSWLSFIGHMKDSLWMRRFVSLRIDPLAKPLGHGGDGRVHTSDHWLWR